MKRLGLLLLVICSVVSVRAQDAAPVAFREVPWSLAPLFEGSRTSMRIAPVEVRAELFGREAATRFGQILSNQKRVEFPGLEGEHYVVRFDNVEYAAVSTETLVWTGKVEGQPRSMFAMAVTDGEHHGSLRTEDGKVYSLHYADSGLHWWEQVDVESLPQDAEPLEPTVGALLDSERLADDDGSTIDVMVLYTPDARSAQGGVPAMNNLIATAIATTNQAYASSGVIQRLRLVHSAEVAYNETGSGTTDLSRLTNSGDGFLDLAQSLRDTYRADIVTLMVSRSDVCGVSWLFRDMSRDFSGQAFNIVRRDCAVDNLTYGHELGHVMGAAHDEANANSPGAFPYAFGYQHKVQQPYFRTVMAYQCSGGINCPRIAYFSN
ncbi:MAG TPA: M12 family metallo-peptidase, partial [Bryobacteraceae bacterium]|nr:M12 family metallo-peptidase [Bryobacteraceae bacterium]